MQEPEARRHCGRVFAWLFTLCARARKCWRGRGRRGSFVTAAPTGRAPHLIADCQHGLNVHKWTRYKRQVTAPRRRKRSRNGKASSGIRMHWRLTNADACRRMPSSACAQYKLGA